MFLNELKHSKKAFTLAELLITVGILGALAAITLPYLFGSMPDKNDAKIKKATYQIETVVAQMYDDDTAYPKKSDISAIGFQNTEKVRVNGKDFGSNGSSTADIKEKKEKFAKLFVDKFNLASFGMKDITEPPKCNSTDKSCKPPTKVTFKTNDGVEWYLPATNFEDGYSVMMIDVDGSDGPNCYKDPSNADACKKPDRFVYYITRNGTVATSKPTKSDSKTHKIDLTEYHHITSTSSAAGSVDVNKIQYKDNKTYKSASGITKSCDSFEAVEAESLYKRVCHLSGFKEKTVYRLTASPNTGYLSNWVNGVKTTKILDTDKLEEVTFSKAVSRCINIKIENCAAVDPNDCIKSAVLKGNCSYVSGTHYIKSKYETDGNLYYYEYVGACPSGKTCYDYSCSKTIGSFSINKSNMYRYVTNTKTGISEKDTETAGRYLHYCDNIVSDYQIILTPNESKNYTLNSYDSTIPESNIYTQNVHSGTEDIDFLVTLKQK